MSRKTDEPTRRCHVMLFEADWDFLVNHIGDKTGVSFALRLIIRDYVKRIQAKVDGAVVPPTIDATELLEDAKDVG